MVGKVEANNAATKVTRGENNKTTKMRLARMDSKSVPILSTASSTRMKATRNAFETSIGNTKDTRTKEMKAKC